MLLFFFLTTLKSDNLLSLTNKKTYKHDLLHVSVIIIWPLPFTLITTTPRNYRDLNGYRREHLVCIRGGNTHVGAPVLLLLWALWKVSRFLSINSRWKKNKITCCGVADEQFISLYFFRIKKTSDSRYRLSIFNDKNEHNVFCLGKIEVILADLLKTDSKRIKHFRCL